MTLGHCSQVIPAVTEIAGPKGCEVGYEMCPIHPPFEILQNQTHRTRK